MIGTDPTRTAPGRGRVVGSALRWVAGWSLRLVLMVLPAAEVIFLIGQLWVICLPVAMALILATLLRPPVNWLCRHRWPAALAALVVLVAALGVLGGIGALLESRVAGQLVALAAQSAAGLAQLQRWLAGPPLHLGVAAHGSLVPMLTTELAQRAGTVASTALSTVSTLTSGLLTALLTVVLLFFVP